MAFACPYDSPSNQGGQLEQFSGEGKENSSEDPRNWGLDAACKGMPSDWWFPDRFNTREAIENTRTAKKICSTCKVKIQCLELANATSEPFGIWGGLTPKERGFRRMTRPY
jgi:WhiB family redox-sensing transcriptional regulator